jgi:hypothetical protein
LDAEEEASFHKRHAPRHNAVSMLEDSGVDGMGQNAMGRWEMDKRTQNYLWYKLSRQAVLSMAGTPKNDFGSQQYKPTWSLVQPSESLKSKAAPIASEWKLLWNKVMSNPDTYHSWKDNNGKSCSGPSISAKAFNDVSCYGTNVGISALSKQTKYRICRQD